jgi:spoIIIJ-associated protein
VASSAEGSGRTVEAAVEAARSSLGVARDAVEIEVLQEPVQGTFGVVGRPARVRVTAREGAARDAPARDAPAREAPARDHADAMAVTAGAVVGRVATTPPAGGVPVAGDRRGGAVSERAPSPTPRPPRPRVDVDPEAAVQQAEAAGDFVEGLLELLDLEADITTWADKHGGHVEVEGPDLNLLVGRDGETLSAVEELTRLAAVRQTGDRVRVVLDINGFRERRREALAKLARETGERVLGSGSGEELAPMPPHERKVVHDVIAEMAGVATESVGEEPNRRVAIVPA